MKISEAKFTKRFNLGNYEHEEFSLTAIVEEDESAVGVLADLKNCIQESFSGEVASPVDGEADEVDEEEEVKPPKSKKKAAVVEEDEPEEVDEEEVEEDEEEDQPPKKTKAEERKAFKKKPQVYQRGNEAHKEFFSNVLKEVAPNWKKDATSKAKGKLVSMKMEGKEFIDHTGEVVPGFRAEVKKLMAKK